MRQVNIVLCDQFKEFDQLRSESPSDGGRFWQRQANTQQMSVLAEKRTGDYHTVGTALYTGHSNPHTSSVAH